MREYMGQTSVNQTGYYHSESRLCMPPSHRNLKLLWDRTFSVSVQLGQTTMTKPPRRKNAHASGIAKALLGGSRVVISGVISFLK